MITDRFHSKQDYSITVWVFSTTPLNVENSIIFGYKKSINDKSNNPGLEKITLDPKGAGPSKTRKRN